MKPAKTVVLMLFLTLAAAAWNYFLYFAEDVAPTTGRRALFGLSSDICRVALYRPGQTCVELTAEDGRWRLTSPFRGSADRQVVMRLLDAVVQTPVVDVLSDSELLKLGRTRADFALDAPVLTLEVSDGRGVPTRCRFGAPTPTGDGIYAAVDGVDAVFVVKPSVLESADVSADGFRRRSLFPDSSESVQTFAIRREGGTPLEFVRTDGGWTVDGKAAAPAVVDYIARLTAAAAVRFVWPVGVSNETDRASASLLASYGLDPDSAVAVTLTASSGVIRRVAFGKPDGEGFVYALVQNGSAVVTVPSELRDFAVQDPVMFADSRIFPEDARGVSCYSIAADGGLYSLSRGPDSIWRLESPVVAAADQATAEGVLSRILSLSPADVVEKGGVAVTIGTNATKVSVSRNSVLGKRTFEDFRSREMLKIDPSLVKRIVSAPKDADAASVVYDRERRRWNAENRTDGRTVSSAGIGRVLSAVNPLVAVRVEKLNVAAADLDDYGLDVPFLTVAVDQMTDEAVRRNILLGKRTKGGRFATIGSSDAIFVVSDEAVRKLASSLVAP